MSVQPNPYVPAFKSSKVQGAIKKKRVLQYLVSNPGVTVVGFGCLDQLRVPDGAVVSVQNRAELSEALKTEHKDRDHKIPFEGFYTGVLFVGETIIDDD